MKNNQKGVIIEFILVFGTIFLILLGSLLGYIVGQLKSANMRAASALSFDIAESGLNFYRWCLNHGVDAQCQGEHEYYNTDGVVIGKFRITAQITTYCNVASQYKITSTGWTNQFPQRKQTIVADYAQPSVAQYSYILNSNVWVGDDHIIRGPYHSNGGIRIDGQNQSLIASAAILNGQGAWICNASFDCDPCPTAAGQCHISGSNCVCPGVFTTTANATPSLFSYPVTPFDFNAITINLATIKDKAQHAGGVYLPQSTTLRADAKGYHLKFRSDGTVQVYIITTTSRTYGCANDCTHESDWQYDYFTISSEYLYNTYTIPPACSAIYAEDNLWVEGVIKGKIVVASANLVDTNVDTDIILNNNITYASGGLTDGLSLIAEKNILIGPDSANNLELHGIFTAQKGHFGRNHYPNNMKNSLIIYGSIVSNDRVGTQWISGAQMVSGYAQRESYYDREQVKNPPPFIGITSPDYKIVNWRQTN